MFIRVLNALLGLWLFASAFMSGSVSLQFINVLLISLLVMCFGMASILGRHGARRVNAALGAWGERAADPFNDHEPVDSSAAAIAAQGLIRLARVIAARGGDGRRYEQAGLRVLHTLIDDAGPYLSVDPSHQGLLLHSIYHRPNGWDHVPEGSRIPRGESSMWGDYHLREAALLVKRMAEGAPYLTFFGPMNGAP